MAKSTGADPVGGQMDGDIERVLVTREQIRRRVARLGREVSRAYAGRELTIVAVLTGSLIFLADLIRQMPTRVRICVISVSSYVGKSTKSNGKPTLSKLPDIHPGADVLIVDDILDTGNTLGALVDTVREMGAASVRTCVLLQKRHAAGPRLGADFVGFEVGEEFVVGYGLDHDNLYRNLPEVCVLRQHAQVGKTSPQAKRRVQDAIGDRAGEGV